MPTASDRAVGHGAARPERQRGENLLDEDRQVPFSHGLHLSWSDGGPIGPETHEWGLRDVRHGVARPRSRGRPGERPAPPARPRSWPGTAARPMAPRSRAGSAPRPRRPRPREAGVLAQVATGRAAAPARSSSTSTAPEDMKRANSRALGLVMGRARIFSASDVPLLGREDAQAVSSHRASVAPWARRARKRDGIATRPRSSSACRNSPVRKGVGAMRGIYHSPHLAPLWTHRPPFYRAGTARQGISAQRSMGPSYRGRRRSALVRERMPARGGRVSGEQVSLPGGSWPARRS